MGVLDRLVGSTERIAIDAEISDEKIIAAWKQYFETFSKKKIIIGRLKIEFNFQKDVQELRGLLLLGLVDVPNEEREESELISDLESIEHSKKIKRVHRLEHCLGYAETKYEYVYGLLRQLHSILKFQIHLVQKMIVGSNNPEKLISHLKSQLELELEIIKKIEKIETFHNLFLTLVKGEHIVKSMDSKEKKLLSRMQKGMDQIFSNNGQKFITYEWTMAVFDAIEDKVHEGVANGMFPGYHSDIDFELVNRPEFVHLVREKIYALKGPHQEINIVTGKTFDTRQRKVSEQMINIFVHLFREWYNHNRD